MKNKVFTMINHDSWGINKLKNFEELENENIIYYQQQLNENEGIISGKWIYFDCVNNVIYWGVFNQNKNIKAGHPCYTFAETDVPDIVGVEKLYLKEPRYLFYDEEPDYE